MLPLDTILVVEDEPDAVVLLKHALQKAAVTNPVQVAEDGEQAVAYLRGDGPFADRSVFPAPSVVLLDLKLPRRTGFEVLEWIKSHDEWRILPVVVLTSSQERNDVDRAYRSGANSYLVKPTSLHLLVKLLECFRDYWLSNNHSPAPPIIADERSVGTKPR